MWFTSARPPGWYLPPQQYATFRRSPVCVWKNDRTRSGAGRAAAACARDGTSAPAAAETPSPRNTRLGRKERVLLSCCTQKSPKEGRAAATAERVVDDCPI